MNINLYANTSKNKKKPGIKLVVRFSLTLFLVLLPAKLYATPGITISVKNAPLQLVFQEIQRQTNYSFFYCHEALEKSKPVNLHVTNASINKVLQLCFKDQPHLDYTIRDSMIIVSKARIRVLAKCGRD